MTEESHREAMNAAIRAQRERANVPKSMLPPEDEPPAIPAAPEPIAPEPEPEPEPLPGASGAGELPGRASAALPPTLPANEPVARRGFLSRLLGR